MKPAQKGTPFISKNIDAFLASVYHAAIFTIRFFKELFSLPFAFREFIRQCYLVGVKSVVLISLTGIITGVVFTLQFRPVMVEFGAEAWIPSMVAIAVVRALAPLITSLIGAGKVGSSIGAELGAMRVSDQIDAMEVSGVNPFKHLVVTRVLATTIMFPVLTIYFGLMCGLGSFLQVNHADQTSMMAFIEGSFEKIDFFDYSSALLRSFIYGLTVGLVGCYQGYYTNHGTEGVGKAANRSVVISNFLLFIEEAILVQLIDIFHGT